MPTPNPNAAIFEAYAKDMDVKIEMLHSNGEWAASSIAKVLQSPGDVFRLAPQVLHICGYTTPAPTEQGGFEVFMRLNDREGQIQTAVYKHIHLIDATAHFNLLKRASTPV